MKHTKQNVIKVLAAMNQHALDMHRLSETEEEKTKYLRESMVFDRCIWALTDKEYFDKMVEIFKVGKEKSDES